MIRDATLRGAALADFYLAIEPRLWADLDEAGALPAAGEAAGRATARAEWRCFALYACVRGLIAAGGFNRETGAAIETLHERVVAAWREAGAGADDALRARISERYAEYGTIGQTGGASAAATVGRRLGEAAARHMAGGDPPAALAELAGALHESLAEGAAESVRQAE